MIRWALKLSEFNIEWEHRPGTRYVVADVLSRNPVDNVEGSQISFTALRALALNSREQLIQEQREDPELGHIYRYLENPEDRSVNATVCEEVDDEFSALKTKAFRILLPFSTSYLCETGFSAVAVLKTKYRSQLNMEKELRVSISKTKPSFKNLCSSRQAHGNH
ncbi:zinc finger BED domain-containing protein 5 [Trichonephila clavipes]|nr:zinc finger BED domain-containing protein 5 [Trichonephila clavipes]